MEPNRFDPYSPPTAASAAPVADDFVGRPAVGGWLLFFCVAQTIILPLTTAGRFVGEYAKSEPMFHTVTGLRTTFLVDLVLSAGIVAVALNAGSRLWARKPRAVQTARAALLIQLAYGLAAGFIPFLLMSDLGPEGNAVLTKHATTNGVRAVISFAIWFSYLSRSRRVAETYPDSGIRL